MGELTLTNLNEAQAHQTAQEVVRLEAVLSKLKDDLKSYVEQNGEFVAAGKVWSFSDTVSVKLTSDQKAEIAKTLAIKGVNFFDVAKFSYTDLIKQGFTVDEMKQLGSVSYSKRFSSTNAK